MKSGGLHKASDLLDLAFAGLGDVGRDEMELAMKLAEDFAAELAELLDLRAVNYTLSVRTYLEPDDD